MLVAPHPNGGVLEARQADPGARRGLRTAIGLHQLPRCFVNADGTKDVRGGLWRSLGT